MKPISFLLLVIFALAACSSDEKTEKPKGVLTEVQTNTLEQAKTVTDTLQKSEEERRKILEAAE
jgi:uncharacterized lipoprotein